MFPSPKSIELEFVRFWNLLSFDAVCDGKLDEEFRTGPASVREYHRPIEGIVDADATYARNPLNVALRPYVEKFFGDIAKQSTTEVLKECYVHSRPIEIIDDDLKLAIRGFIPAFAKAPGTQIATSEYDEGGNFEIELRHRISKGTSSGSVVMIIGGIGSGKSTFLHRFFTVVCPELVSKEGPILLLPLDFLWAPDRVSDLDEFIWQKPCRGTTASPAGTYGARST